ncbi:hypothetical protein EIN_016600, partial [Entamoeba invadens IP1]|uniref:hypothetical protein n=1 Tax=Entamoeba invadens IP1 TaxID=370355 RepID=UPI0002C3E246
VPLEIKNYISQNYILHAVVLINRATDVGRKPYMEKVVDLVQTIADIKRQREKMAYVVKTNMELLCMKIAMSVNSESMTPSEIEYAKHQQVPQFPYKYKNSDIDAEMCLNESLALKADFDFQEQLIALSSAACILGEKVCQNIITAILESNVESLNVVFGIHRLSPDKKVPVETDFIDQGTFQKIKGKTQHLSSVDRFDLCLKIVLRMICLHALLCAKMEEFKGKMVEYNQSIDVDELEVSFAATKDERVRESITSKRSRWGRRIAKPKIIESMFTEQKEEKHVELQQTKSFVKSSLEFVWDKIQKFLYKVLVLRIFETEENATKNITETKPFVFANAEDGGDKDESEKYKLARKTLTAENVRKLLASLENFLKNVKDTCMFDEESKYSIIEKCITLIKKDLKDNKYTM